MNAKNFLKKGEFVNVEENEKLMRKNFEVFLNIMGKRVAFEVVDDFYYLKNRKKIRNVVAIFIKGTPY